MGSVGVVTMKWYWTLPSARLHQDWWELFCGYMNVGLIGAGVGIIYLVLDGLWQNLN